MKKSKFSISNNLIMAIAMIALGILFIIMKAGVISIAMTVFGVALLVVAVIDLLNKDWVPCVIKAVLGIAVIVFGWALVDIARYILAGVLLIYGVLQVIDTVKKLKQNKTLLSKLLVLVEPVVIVAIAIFLFFNVDILFIIAGIFFLIEGVLALIKALK